MTKRKVIKAPPSQKQINLLQTTVAEFYGVTIEEFMGEERSERIAWPRMVLMYFLMEAGTTGEHCARILGRKRGAGSHGQRAVQNACDCYPEKRTQIGLLRRKLTDVGALIGERDSSTGASV
jgi:hypothetical protein